MWNFLRKAKDKKEKINGSQAVAFLTPIQREDMLALRQDGLLPSEIAAQMGIEPSQVSKAISLEKTRLERQAASVKQEQEDPIIAMNIEIKRLELEQKRLQMQWELEDRRAERAEELASYNEPREEGKEPDMIQTLLASILTAQTNKANVTGIGGGFSQSFPPQAPQAQECQAILLQEPTQKPELSEEDINNILDGIDKKWLRMAQKMPDSTLIGLIKGQMPNYGDNTYQLALKCLKSRSL